MQPNERNAIHRVLDAIQNEALRIRALEAEAGEALFIRNDKEAYSRKLKEKTMILMELPETLEPLLDNLDAETRDEIHAGLANFSRRAGQAWELSSLFYMSALLYPDDYVEGDKNDLERFIDLARASFSR